MVYVGRKKAFESLAEKLVRQRRRFLRLSIDFVITHPSLLGTDCKYMQYMYMQYVYSECEGGKVKAIKLNFTQLLAFRLQR